jgi:hypothetical protein
MAKATKGGDCYEVAGDRIINDPTPGLILAHGMVIGSKGDGPGRLPHGHAWIEAGDECIDESNGHGVCLPKALYYKLGSVHTVRFYNREQARMMMMTTEHYGPWEDE